MATQEAYYLEMSFVDSRKKSSPVRWRVDPVKAVAWLDAADAAARAATDLGLLITRANALSEASLFSWGVTLESVNDTAVAPNADAGIYNFDKVTVQFKAALKNYTGTIPARDDAALNVNTDGVSVIISGAGANAAVTNFITSFEACVLADNAVAPTVTGMYVSQ